jgi:xylose isomerase
LDILDAPITFSGWMQIWPWEDASLDDMEMAYRRMRAMFEFLDKLGVDYWCFHDRCRRLTPS